MAVPGQLLDDRYELIRCIGQGGMGEVWAADDRKLGRPVAVKILAEGPAADPDLIRRLRREARTAATLQHPGITVVFDTSGENADPYVVMELLDGRNLNDVLADGLPPATAVTLMAGVADALDYAHRKGVVHRDIKPANLMLLNDGTGRTVKICDFGIARLADATRLTLDGGVPGTPLFLAPELYQGREADARSDLYAFGVTLHLLLTGEPPLAGPPARTALGDDLDTLLRQLLARDPADRPATAGQVRDRLRKIVVGGRAVDGPPGTGVTKAYTTSVNPPGPELRHELTGHEGPVVSVALSPDGGVVASASGKRARLWDATTGRLVRKFPRSGGVHAVALSPDGHTLVTGAWNGVYRWHVKGTTTTPNRAMFSRSPSVHSLAFRCDGYTIACGTGKTNIRIVDIRSGEEVASLDGHPGLVRSVAFSPDGHLLASTGGGEYGYEALCLWDPVTGERLHWRTGLAKQVNAVAFSPDSTRVATADSDQRVRVWDVHTGELLQEISGHMGAVYAVAYSPDGRYLASAGYDQTIHLSDPATGQPVHKLFGHHGIVRALAFAPGGGFLASGGDDRRVLLWSMGG